MSTLALHSPLPSRSTAPSPAPAPAAPTPAMAAPLSVPDWQPARSRRAAAAVTLGLHLLGALALLQAGRAVVTHIAPAPIQISLLQERQRPPEPQPQALPSTPQALPVQPALALPLPEFEAAVPSPRTVQAVVQPAVAAVQAPTPAEPAPAQIAPQPPQPKTVAASALRYRVEPAVEVPLLSRRAGEHGRVALRVVFDPQGRPRDIQLQRSSGFARLDAQAVEAMKAARIAPIVEDGRAIEVMAVAWLEYELD
ncbi:energy transducer TonB [Inhella proteolytica]|uniref:TonB family protein n=1 Tax=Inhella proteolytica TaxID=2795029 RepID=A0A931J2R1_9BURK|nr:energy transducer TonB [Inhella proteolytica]MBH9578499.1 TonB family protein [Inhella proteolytica]